MNKKEFISNWLDDNWINFVAGTLLDHRGKLVTVADALELTAMEAGRINEAFMRGACATHDAIEVIAKAWLLDVVACHFYDEYLQKQEDLKANMKDDEAQLAFENYDMKR